MYMYVLMRIYKSEYVHILCVCVCVCVCVCLSVCRVITYC